MSNYEYGIQFSPDSKGTPHRTGMTEKEARKWVAESEGMGFPSGSFSVVRRKLEPWESADFEKELDVTLEEYLAYEEVRRSGETNMLLTKRVSELSGLSPEKILTIIENYDDLSSAWG